jgi:hypothetical protein
MNLKWRNHLSEGYLRAYQDGELDRTGSERVQIHLDSCESCRKKERSLIERAAYVREHIEKHPSARPSTADRLTRARLDTYISTKEVQPMYKKIFARQSRLIWAGVLLLAIVVSTFAFPGVRAVATNFLGLFRVEKVAAIPFNPANIPDDMSNAGPRIEQMLAEDMTFEKHGEPYDVSNPAEASAASGIPVRLPSELGEPAKISVQPGARLTFTVDLPRIRVILDEMGRQDIDLPQLLQGETVTADLPTSVTALYGDCEMELEAAHARGYDRDHPRSGSSNCLVLVQLASPTVSAPPGLDINQIGTTFLELTGMSPEEAERFSQTVDWATTLIIPVPNYSSSSEVMVDEEQGVLIHQPDRGDRARFMLAWVKNGVVYSLSGQGSPGEAVDIANTLK